MNGVLLYDEAGRAPVSGPWEKKPGLANSDGDAVVAADMGYCLKSIPYPDEVSILRFGPRGPRLFGCCGTGAKMLGLWDGASFGCWMRKDGMGLLNMEKSTAIGTDLLRCLLWPGPRGP